MWRLDGVNWKTKLAKVAHGHVRLIFSPLPPAFCSAMSQWFSIDRTALDINKLQPTIISSDFEHNIEDEKPFSALITKKRNYFRIQLMNRHNKIML